MGKRHTVSDIVAAVYCEQKLVFDKRHGKARSADIERKAAAGTFEHLRFQWEGYTRNPGRLLAKLGQERPGWRPQPKPDSRCFIASQVYGPLGAETDALRAWRDRALMPSRAGRAFVALYYAVSPALVWLLKRSPRLTSAVRRALDGVVKRVGGAR